MTTCNAVNEAQAPVVEAPRKAVLSAVDNPAAHSAKPGQIQSCGNDPDGGGCGKAALPQKQACQSPKENAHYAALRRCRTQLEQLLDRMKELTGQDWQACPRQAEDAPGRELALVSRLLEDPGYQAARLHALYCRKLAYRHVMEQDLQQLQRHFPEAKIQRLEDLGEDYFAMRENGMDPLVAGAAALQLRDGKNRPPEMGLVTRRAAGPKDYYTPGEVDRLSQEELRDPGVMAAVRYSMTKWKHR